MDEMKSKIIAHSRHDPESGLLNVAVVDVFAVQEVVALHVDIPSRFRPGQSGVHERVGRISVALVLHVEIAAHAVLEPVLDGEVEVPSYIEFHVAGKLVLQVFEGILAYDAAVLLLVLVHPAVSHRQSLQEMLRW
mgnify:CR=1 FL=1